MNIYEPLRRIVSGRNLQPVERAQVLAVNGETCIVKMDDGLELAGVKLPDEGVILYPVVGSRVIIGQVGEDDSDLCVLVCTEITRLKWAASGLVIDAQANGQVAISAKQITLNGGGNKGLVNIEELIVRLNKLEKSLNALSGSFQSHTHIGVRGGTDTSGGTLAGAPASLPITSISDLEDKNVTH